MRIDPVDPGSWIKDSYRWLRQHYVHTLRIMASQAISGMANCFPISSTSNLMFNLGYDSASAFFVNSVFD